VWEREGGGSECQLKYKITYIRIKETKKQ